MAKRLPKGFRRSLDESIACPHRDVSVCPTCERKHAEIVDAAGRHYWVDCASERAELRALAMKEKSIASHCAAAGRAWRTS